MQKLQSSDECLYDEISEICFDLTISRSPSGAPELLKKFRPFEKIFFSWYAPTRTLTDIYWCGKSTTTIKYYVPYSTKKGPIFPLGNAF